MPGYMRYRRLIIAGVAAWVIMVTAAAAASIYGYVDGPHVGKVLARNVEQRDQIRALESTLKSLTTDRDRLMAKYVHLLNSRHP